MVARWSRGESKLEAQRLGGPEDQKDTALVDLLTSGPVGQNETSFQVAGGSPGWQVAGGMGPEAQS